MKYPLLLLGLILITLKLTGYIAWSWLWVLAPMWIPLALSTIYYAVRMGVFLLIMNSETKVWPRRFI